MSITSSKDFKSLQRKICLRRVVKRTSAQKTKILIEPPQILSQIRIMYGSVINEANPEVYQFSNGICFKTPMLSKCLKLIKD